MERICIFGPFPKIAVRKGKNIGGDRLNLEGNLILKLALLI
jgi:hypothetical protein